MGKGDTLLNAVIGAVVTVFLSFTGVSPLLGGGVAGYLQGEPPKGGAKVGAISGAIAFVPFLVVVIVGSGILLTGMVGRGMMGVPGGAELLVILLVLFPVFVVWNVGLSAVGGYLAAYIRAEREESG